VFQFGLRKDDAVASVVLYSGGGGGESGDPCEALHHHGFIGMEKEAVDLIVGWIQKPTN